MPKIIVLNSVKRICIEGDYIDELHGNVVISADREDDEPRQVAIFPMSDIRGVYFAESSVEVPESEQELQLD